MVSSLMVIALWDEELLKSVLQGMQVPSFLGKDMLHRFCWKSTAEDKNMEDLLGGESRDQANDWLVIRHS